MHAHVTKFVIALGPLSLFEGNGRNHTIEVESNNIGEMRVDKLKESSLKVQANGDIPLMVVITTGNVLFNGRA